MYSCRTDKSEVYKDIISYNEKVLNKTVTNCVIVDEDASCAHKSESYIVECEGCDAWYKWDVSSRTGSKVRVYTLPKNFDNYRCNPGLDYKKQFKGYVKQDSGWVAMEYTDN
jgi:hypothetical protein